MVVLFSRVVVGCCFFAAAAATQQGIEAADNGCVCVLMLTDEERTVQNRIVLLSVYDDGGSGL